MKIKIRRKTRSKNSFVEPLHIYEWSVDGGKFWFPINEQNIRPYWKLRRNLLAMEIYRKLMNKVAEGETIEVSADYEKPVLWVTAVPLVCAGEWK